MTILQISAKIYWGFQVDISKEDISFLTIDEIILHVKNQMKSFFKTHNLLELQEGVDNLNLHIHNFNIKDPVIYLCDHC
jgi:hypothetical protein